MSRRSARRCRNTHRFPIRSEYFLAQLLRIICWSNADVRRRLRASIARTQILRQHGTLFLLWVVFSPVGEKRPTKIEYNRQQYEHDEGTCAMHITAYAEINELLDSLLAQIQAVLEQKLVGVYLFGSLVWGDFDQGSSDIDLLVATASDIDDQEFSDLDQMQLAFVDKHARWENRIEILYVTTAALQAFKSHSYKLAVISPGEPFHIKEADKGWLMNWYMVQEQGRTLFGPAPTTLIDPISTPRIYSNSQTACGRLGRMDLRCAIPAIASLCDLNRVSRAIHLHAWCPGLEAPSGRMGSAGVAPMVGFDQKRIAMACGMAR